MPMISSVFVYGTLMPGQPRWAAVDEASAGAPVRDSIRGRLFDTGSGYPALVTADRHSTVKGWRVLIEKSALVATLAYIDEIEGTDVGLYRRIAVDTDSGVPCWTYEYLQPTAEMPDLGGRWPADDQNQS